jgi:ABC-type branched-subunit amino acid transport system substrate-binding protein
MLDLTTREKVIALNNGSAPAIGDASKFPYSFSAGVGNVAQANFILKELEAKGYKNVGILTASGAFGEALSKQYQETFQAAGLTVIPESYEPDAVEMDGPLGRINDANPDVVVFNDFVHPAYALKSRIKVGMADVPFIGDISTTINDMSQTVSTEEKDGVLLSSYKVQTSAADRPGVTNLLATLKENNVTISSGLYLYALAYDTVLAYANAVEAIGSTDVDAVRAAMEAGKGDKYQLSLTDSIGWTQDTHIGSGQDENLFTLIPVSPMVSGQFQLAG